MMNFDQRNKLSRVFRAQLSAVIISMGLCLCLPQKLSSADIRGNLASDLYGWSENDKDHLRPYLTLRTNLTTWRAAGNKNLSFHSYWRWTTDWNDKSDSDPQLFIYDAYAKLSGIPSGMTAYLGRQFVYSAVGSALLDGIRIRYTPISSIQVDIFGGSSVSRLDPETLRSFSDFGIFGSRFSYRFHPQTRFGISWMRRQSDGFVSYHRLGADIKQTFHDWTLYVRSSVNPEIRRPSELLARVRFSPNLWQLSAEYLWRDPSVSYNSVFSLIEFKRYRELRLEAQRNIKRGLALFGHIRADFFSSDNSWSAKFGIRTGVITAAWVHQNGHGGDTDGLIGTLNIQVGKSWQLYGRLNISQYRVQREQDSRSEAYATAIGVMKRFGGDLQARAEWQYLRNAVQSYDSRFHLRISRGFAFK